MKNAIYILLALVALFLVWSLIHFVIAAVVGLAFKLLLIAVFVAIVYALYKMLTREKQRS